MIIVKLKIAWSGHGSGNGYEKIISDADATSQNRLSSIRPNPDQYPQHYHL